MIKKNETPSITEEKKTPYELKNTKGIAVGKDRIERFQASFRGEVSSDMNSDFGMIQTQV